ncbi:hypothetical protein BP6252_00884 [Coleophoma cylindrospora]|uniref:DNA polymerase lambda n=1 Tax=Coleophoma cylindrospora TaxID=1849047 RepID=A0A3D8SRD3_9HELO|nr:hypothetical protein BP6252_00884 [Coleophoma cylindrospora]
MANPDKAAYFQQLEALSRASDDDDEVDDNDVRSILRNSEPLSVPASVSSRISNSWMLSQRPRTPTLLKKLPPHLSKVESAPTPASSRSVQVVKETPIPRIAALRASFGAATTPASSEPSLIKETPLGPSIFRPGAERRSISTPILGASTSSLALATVSVVSATMVNKRKRKFGSITLKPDHELRLKGLVFYYIPPDDTAPARRKQIVRAREHGATWAKELQPDVTHIIADKDLTYKDVMSFLKLDALPADVVLVNENYPLDCCISKSMLNPREIAYVLDGFSEVVGSTNEASLVPQTSQRSEMSLELKPAETKPNRWDFVPPKETPPRSEESTQIYGASASRAQNIAEPESSTGLSSGRLGSSLVESLQQATDSPIAKNTSSKTPHISGGVLDDIIEKAKQNAHLPLDDTDDDLPASSGAEDIDDSDSEALPTAKRKASQTKMKPFSSRPFKQDSFSCMRGGTGNATSNPNDRTIEIMQEMCDHYSRTNDHWRTTAYRKAIGTLKRQPERICLAEDARRLPFIGQRLADKIEEIVRTDSLRRLESAKAEPTDQILRLFLNIYQVGNSTAWRWIQKGYKTLEDLKEHVDLTENQKLGIEHYDDLLQRIPRHQVTELAKIVEEASKMIEPAIKVIIGGSYRRGAATSGDLDCIITMPGTSSSKQLLPFLSKLVNNLTSSGFLVAALAQPSAMQGDGSKWHGCCILPSDPAKTWRRIDILLVPDSELGAALIYFTGDDIFNRSLRLLASKYNCRLNQRGLYKDVLRGDGRVKLTEGSLIEGADEVKIFEALGVPWRPPHERICN